jgi:hypothetical protein
MQFFLKCENYITVFKLAYTCYCTGTKNFYGTGISEELAYHLVAVYQRCMGAVDLKKKILKKGAKVKNEILSDPGHHEAGSPYQHLMLFLIKYFHNLVCTSIDPTRENNYCLHSVPVLVQLSKLPVL